MLVNMFQFDSEDAKTGISAMKMPSQDEQARFYKNLTDKFEVKQNALYHIISRQWFDNWQAFVGLIPFESLNKTVGKEPGPINNPVQLN
jgi:hypothetical protein